MPTLMPDSLFSFLQGSSIGSFFIKAFGITLTGLFLAFSFILKRQVGIMRKTIMLKDNGLLDVYVMVQLVISLVLFVYALVIL